MQKSAQKAESYGRYSHQAVLLVIVDTGNKLMRIVNNCMAIQELARFEINRVRYSHKKIDNIVPLPVRYDVVQIVHAANYSCVMVNNKISLSDQIFLR